MAKREPALSIGSFFFNDTATTEIYTLSLHDALPIYESCLMTRAWYQALFTGTTSRNAPSFFGQDSFNPSFFPSPSAAPDERRCAVFIFRGRRLICHCR